jgi:DNA-binding NtrC family response regulator
MIVEVQPTVEPLLAAAPGPAFALTLVRDGDSAVSTLGREEFHAVIIDMAIAGSDPLGIANHAAARGCGTILMPDIPAQFKAAARAGHFILSKPPSAKRLIDLVQQACAVATLFSTAHAVRRRAPDGGYYV